MPLFSDLNSYYYTGSLPSTSHYYHMPTTYSIPSRISSPFSFSYLSPLTAMMSAGIGLNPMPRGLMSRSAYTPILPSISETSSPILSRRELGSPRNIGGKVYYRAPRPVVIDTADIDVSKRKKDEDDSETSTSGKIHRGRSVVRIHTKKLKENPGLKKKTQGELLMEKFLIKEKPERKDEPRRRRVWETNTIAEDTSASPPQVTPTMSPSATPVISPSATPVCRRGTIKRYYSGVRKKSDIISDEEVTEKVTEAASDKKASIDEFLKEEAAVLDSMIQEEMAKPVNEMLTKRKKSSDLPDIDDTGTKHKTKTKREGKLYGGKKSSKTLPLDIVDKSDESVSKVYVSKKSSKTLPLDAVSEVTNKGGEDSTVTTEQKQSEGKVMRKSCKSYKKKHSGPLKFIIGSIHVEEKSSPKPARKLNYEVIIEEGNRVDGTRETLRDIKKRKSKKHSVKRHYSPAQKSENEDTVQIHDMLKSKESTCVEAFDSNSDVTKLKENLDNSSNSDSIKDETKTEKCAPDSSINEKEDEVNNSDEKIYDSTKLAIKNFLEKVVHKTDLPQVTDDIKHKTEKDAEIKKESDTEKSVGKVQSDAVSRENYYDKFKNINMLLKSAKENSVTIGDKAIGFSPSAAEHTIINGAQPNTKLKDMDSVVKTNNKKIIPDIIKSGEEKKTAENIDISKQTEIKGLQKFKEMPVDQILSTDKNVLSSNIIETNSVNATNDNKEKNKSDYISDKLSIEKLGITSNKVTDESTSKVGDIKSKEMLPSKPETSSKIGNLKQKLEKSDQKVDVKYQSESNKLMNKDISLSETTDTKHLQGGVQEPGKKETLDVRKLEFPTDASKINDSDINNTMHLDKLNVTGDLTFSDITKNSGEKYDLLKFTKQFPEDDTLKSHEVSKTVVDINKSADPVYVTPQIEEKVTVGTSTTDKVTTVDSKQLASTKKTHPLFKTRKSDVPTREVVHESTKIDKCKVGVSNEETLLSDKHVDNRSTIEVETVTSSVEIHPSDSKPAETESPEENRYVELDSSVLSDVFKEKEKELVKENTSATKHLDSEAGSPLKEVNSSVFSSDYVKLEVQDTQELKKQVNKIENICDTSQKGAKDLLETRTSPEGCSPDSKQHLLTNKTDLINKASTLDDSVYDATKSFKSEDLPVVGSTSETIPAVLQKTDLSTDNKMKQDKMRQDSLNEIHCEEKLKIELSGKKGKDIVADDSTKTAKLISDVNEDKKTAPVETVIKKSDIKSKPVTLKDLKISPETDEPKISEKLKISTKFESPEEISKGETSGTVKENKTRKKIQRDATDVVFKETETGNAQKLVKTSNKDGDKEAESKSTIKVAKSPKHKKLEESKPSPTKRKPLVKKKSTEEAIMPGNVEREESKPSPIKRKPLVKKKSTEEGIISGNVEPEESKPSPTRRKPLVKKKSAEEGVTSANFKDKAGLPKEVVASTENSGKTVSLLETESSENKTETVAKAKVAENTSIESSCVKLDIPNKNTVVKAKDTDKTVDKSVNSETSNVQKDTDSDKHFENAGAIPSPESSSDEESSTEGESSDEEETSEEETSTEEESSDDEGM